MVPPPSTPDSMFLFMIVLYPLLTASSIQFATFLISVCVTWTSARFEDRSLHITVLMLIAAVGNAVATATTSLGGRFFAMFLMPMGAVSACKSPEYLQTLRLRNAPRLMHENRSNYRLVGFQLLPPASGKAIRQHCDSQYVWQHGDHLRIIHVSKLDGPSVRTRRKYECRRMSAGCRSGACSEISTHPGE